MYISESHSMTYNADRQKETQNVVWKLLFSAQTQPIYASCSCSPGCYFMSLTNPRLYSTDLVLLYSNWTITIFYKLCDSWQKYFILPQVALLVCIACFWAKQPHDTYILKLLGIFNQTRHFQNHGISVSTIRVRNTAHQNPSNEFLSFNLMFIGLCIILIVE